MTYSFTAYFENEVLRKRPNIKREWCIAVIESPIRMEIQDNERIRHWGVVADAPGKILRVVTLADGTTIHNAFFDRGFTP